MDKNEIKRDIIFKIIATMLVTIILINVNANIVNALSFNFGKKKEMTIEEINEVEKNRNVEDNVEVREIIGEDIRERKVNQKTFIMTDGTRMVAMYPSDVHYEKDGKLEEIDNQLEEENGAIENKEGAYKIQYSKQSNTEEQLATLTKDNYVIKWRMIEALSEESDITADNLNKQSDEEEIRTDTKENIIEENIIDNVDIEGNITNEKENENQVEGNNVNTTIQKYSNQIAETKMDNKKIKNVQAKIKNTIDEKEVLESINNTDEMYSKESREKMDMSQISSEIHYENIMNETDLKYVNTSESIKESIILKNKEAIQDKYIFQYEANNMVMELNENKEVLVYDKDKNNIIFKIEAPYMFDNSLNQSDEIEVTLEKKITIIF